NVASAGISRINYMPWRAAALSGTAHSFRQPVATFVIAMMFPVFRRNAPRGIRIILEFSQSRALGLFRQLEPHLHNERPISREQTFEVGKVPEHFIETRELAWTARILGQSVTMPPAGIDRHPAAGWQRPPVTPHRR